MGGESLIGWEEVWERKVLVDRTLGRRGRLGGRGGRLLRLWWRGKPG